MSAFDRNANPSWRESLERASERQWRRVDARHRWQRVACAVGAGVLAVAAVVATLRGGL